MLFIIQITVHSRLLYFSFHARNQMPFNATKSNSSAVHINASARTGSAMVITTVEITQTRNLQSVVCISQVFKKKNFFCFKIFLDLKMRAGWAHLKLYTHEGGPGQDFPLT